MSQIPAQLRYTESHEWVRVDPDGSVLVGVTDFAQAGLGELVFVDLPECPREVVHGEVLAVVESTHSAADVYCPVAGEVVEINTALDDSPTLVNEQPYGAGWVVRLRPSESDWQARLLDADAYRLLIEE